MVTSHGVTRLFEPSQQDFEDLYQLRMALEPMAAGLAARRMTDEELLRIRVLLEQTDVHLAAEEVDAFVDGNSKFHDLIGQASKNHRLYRALEEISATARYYRYICFKLYRRQVDSADQHWRIYHALAAREEELAREEMYCHLESDLLYIQSTAALISVH